MRVSLAHKILEGGGEGFEDLAVAGVGVDAFFRMPLAGDGETLVGTLDGLNDAVGRTGRYHQSVAG